jgi:hypothetical protein
MRAANARGRRRQPAEFEKVADHAHARTALLTDAPVRGDQDLAQPLRAFGRRGEGGRTHRNAARRRLVPVTQRAARHRGTRRRRALTLPTLPLVAHHAQLLGARKAIMDWRWASRCTTVSSGRGIGQQRFPRSVSASKGPPPRCSCHSLINRDLLPASSVLDQTMIKALPNRPVYRSRRWAIR